MKSQYLLLLIFTILVLPAQAGSVNRSLFTSAIENREPVDQISEIQATTSSITYFTELLEFKGEKITHQWTFNDNEVYRISFDVNGPRWRTWSSKKLSPGEWRVNVLDAEENIIRSDYFEYPAK